MGFERVVSKASHILLTSFLLWARNLEDRIRKKERLFSPGRPSHAHVTARARLSTEQSEYQGTGSTTNLWNLISISLTNHECKSASLIAAQTFFRGSTAHYAILGFTFARRSGMRFGFLVRRNEPKGPKYAFLLPNLSTTTRLKAFCDS